MNKYLLLLFFSITSFATKAQDIRLIDLISLRSLDYRIFYNHMKTTGFSYQGIQSFIKGSPRKFIYERMFFGDTTLNNSELYVYSLDKLPLKNIYFICHDIPYFETHIMSDLSRYGFSIDVNELKQKGTMTSKEIVYISDDEDVPFKIQVSYLRVDGKNVVALLIYDYK